MSEFGGRALRSSAEPNRLTEHRVLVDRRWVRQVSGIGRFSREVLGRLPDWPSVARGRPWSASDALNLQRLLARPGTIVFSPGYNTGPTRALQLITLHDLMHLDVESSPAKRLYYEHLVRPVVERAGIVLTVSRTSARRIQDWIGHDGVEVRVVGNGCSIAGENGNMPHTRSQAGGLRLLYVGSTAAHKNFQLVPRILKQLPAARLDVVTADPDGARRILAESEIRDDGRVRVIVGASDRELRDRYLGAQALLMPSRVEGFGLPAVEAQMCRLPVVYWSGCEALDEVTGGFGFAVGSLDDAGEWARTVELASASGISEGPEYTRWRELFSWDHVVARVSTAITDLTTR